MIARRESLADSNEGGTDPSGGQRGILIAVPFAFAAILVLIVIVTWVIPSCTKGKTQSDEQRQSARLEKLENAVKSELFMDWAKKAREKHPEGQYDKLLCVICLDELEDASQIRGLGCNHIFHQSCLDDWFGRYNEYCPLCHRPIIPGAVARTPRTRSDRGFERPLIAFVV
ncbi:hypothetical protein BU23DRAFT_532157 [Bimuria novae-zelandiae CBS 107.79]|uniref:RING-type domain-containing protein n=1 Tax=Bimuria novae-zelandiae CBS 107.79 TaxID=1447943 RepID=A0A6A5V9S4_9PLEO|nr:hypothetical protein BU23DRAFT_532157 [Bimuria novae-zelandiae CBS 107.79]